MWCQLFVKTMSVASIVRKDPFTHVAVGAVRGMLHEFDVNFINNLFEPALRGVLPMQLDVAAATVPTVATEKPRNGLAGLKHWRYDLRSGFTVAMISLPFSMGIAITSGAPPICGIVSAIIAGFVLPFLGGSYVTISGPAAGLAPALFAGMILLGHARLGRGASQSDLLAVGYPLVLVAIAIVGVLQVVLAKLKVARLSAIFPAAAMQGMLAAIGLMIIVKQVPLFMGVKFEAHESGRSSAKCPTTSGR
jgi:carbonic anhydrase